MRDGQTVPAQGLRRDGNAVFARIQTHRRQRRRDRLPVANIARIDFPEPAAAQARGRPARRRPGGRRRSDSSRPSWPTTRPSATCPATGGRRWPCSQLDAFARLGRDRDADALVAELASSARHRSPEFMRAVKIKQAAGSERRATTQRRSTLLEPLVKDTTAAARRACRRLADGRRRRSWRSAIQGRAAGLFARPRLHARQGAAHAPGVARQRGAYVGLDDGQRARNALKELIAAYPNSPEAAEAKDRLQGIWPPTPKARRLAARPSPFPSLTSLQLPSMKLKNLSLGARHVRRRAVALRRRRAGADPGAAARSRVPPPPRHQESLFEKIYEGGWVMVPIACARS